MRSNSRLLAVAAAGGGPNAPGGLHKSLSCRHGGAAAGAVVTRSPALARLSARSRARAEFCAAAAKMTAREILRRGRPDGKLLRGKVLRAKVREGRKGLI